MSRDLPLATVPSAARGVADGEGRPDPSEVVTRVPAALAVLLALLDAVGVALALDIEAAPEPHRTAAWQAAELDPRFGAPLAAARAKAARHALAASPAAGASPGLPAEVGRVGERRVVAHAATLDDGRRLVAVIVAPPGGSEPSDEALSAQYGLSAREVQVARLIAAGRSTPQIAAALGISAHTVKRHRERTFAKLGVHSRRAVRARLDEVGPAPPVERR